MRSNRLTNCGGGIAELIDVLPMIFTSLQQAQLEGRKQLAVLIDPDRTNRDLIQQMAGYAERGLIDYFFWGGSLVQNAQVDYYLSLLKALTDRPVLLFPGSQYQLNDKADGLLLLSLISGRNPELLIGQHVQCAARIKQSNLEVIPTGYMLVDGGAPTSVSYMSNTQPIPANKPGIAAATALAGSYLGLKTIYLDAGSGAPNAVSPAVVEAVRSEIELPLIVGGGIRDVETAAKTLKAGADLIVVGNSLERHPNWLPALANVVRSGSKIIA
ncbi:MAG: geranylgeranylglyceryl/heptaprenylglyceryl phosphate synthase [Bacteroidota bacterium]